MSKLVVISGGQTGVDLAALAAAHACGLDIAGWVPRDFSNELGAGGIPEKYRPFLWQTATTNSSERTERNILEADGILTLFMGDTSSPGTQHGIDHALMLGKPGAHMLSVELSTEDLKSEKYKVTGWLQRSDINKCAIGGPRESEAPGIQSKAYEFLLSVFRQLQQSETLEIGSIDDR